jgi:hypothetical protein
MMVDKSKIFFEGKRVIEPLSRLVSRGTVIVANAGAATQRATRVDKVNRIVYLQAYTLV